MDRTVLSEAADNLAGFRIQGIEIIANAGEQALFTARFMLPEDQTPLPGGGASGSFGKRVPLPEFPTTGGIEGDHFPGGRSRVKHTGNDQIVGLVFSFVTGVVGPGDLQLSAVAPVDLLQRRLEAAALIA